MRLAALLAWRAWRKRPGSMLMMALGVACGVAGLHAMRLGTSGALEQGRAVYQSQAGDAALVMRAVTGPQPLPAEAITAAGSDPAVRATRPLVQCLALQVDGGAAWKGLFLPAGQGDVAVIGADLAQPEARWHVVEGGPTGVLVGRALARAGGLAPGRSIALRATRAASWRIGGLIDLSGLGARGLGRVVIAPLAEARELCGVPADAVHELALVLRPGAKPEEVAARLSRPGVTVSPPGARGADVEQRLANLTAATDLLGFVGIFLAGFLIYGLVSARAAELARAVGLLRAAGATRAQATGALVAEVACAALPGAALGAALGWPLAALVAATFGEAAGAELVVSRPDPVGAAIAGAAGFGVALAAALGPSLAAARRPIARALGARADEARLPSRWRAMGSLTLSLMAMSSFVIWPAAQSPRALTLTLCLLGLLGGALAIPAGVGAMGGALTGLARRWLGPAAGLGVAALRWRPRRAGLAAGSVLGAVALVGGVAALGGGLRAEMSAWSARALGWDVYASHVAGFSETDLAGLRALPEVARVAPASIRRLPLDLPRRDEPAWLSLVGIDERAWADEQLLMAVRGGDAASLVRRLADPRSALITEVVEAQFGLAPGDEILVPTLDGDARLIVAGVVSDYTENGFAVLVGQTFMANRLGVTRPELLGFRLRTDADDEPVLRALGAIPGVAAESQAELQGRVLTLVDRSMAALDQLLWLSGLVAVLAVGAAIAQGASERRRDVATLRAIGLTRRQATAMVVTEGAATAALGAGIGLFYGVALGAVFAQATHTLGIPVPYVPPWGPLLGAALAAIAGGGLAAWWPARALSNESPAAVLRADD